MMELDARLAELDDQQMALRRQIDTVEVLAKQIRGIWDSGSYMSEGQEPYKIVSRIAVLAHLIGDTPVWNCKSGKDRTGQLDVEAKFLAWQIAAHGSVPAPDRSRDKEEKAQLFQMVANSGNLEMQKLNTGFPGFKLGGVDSLQAQFGATDAKSWHRGLSGHVKT
jgi:hypothetical protein